jgi:NarL family two-component system response regulator LiaR
MTDKIKVLIVDDHQIARQGLRTFLELQSDIEIVGEAADGLSAVAMVRQHEPDVVLMDLVMPRMDGIEATRQVKSAYPKTKVIALTSFTDDDKLIPAIQAGASSYLLKDVSPDDLVEAIRASHRDEARLHPDVARKLMEKVAHVSSPAQTPLIENLTERELEIVRLIAEGQNNNEIAQKLFISKMTVKTHVSNILRKLDLDDRTQVAIYALKNGLTTRKI